MATSTDNEVSPRALRNVAASLSNLEPYVDQHPNIAGAVELLRDIDTSEGELAKSVEDMLSPRIQLAKEQGDLDERERIHKVQKDGQLAYLRRGGGFHSEPHRVAEMEARRARGIE